METTKEHQGEERMRNGGATRPSPRLRESWRWIMFPLAQLYSTCVPNNTCIHLYIQHTYASVSPY